MPRADDDDVDFECTGDSGGGTLDDNDGENYPTLGQGVSQDNSDNNDNDDNDNPVDNDEKEDDEKHNKDGEYDNDYHDDNELQNNSFNGTGVCFASSCEADPSHGCFNSTKQKLCAHSTDQIMLNNVGDYVIFPSNCFHRGYFSIQSNSVYYTAQMFATPSEKPSGESVPTSRNAVIMTTQVKGTMRCMKLTKLSNDILENWNKAKYQKKEFKPAKCFDGEKIDPSKHCHIYQKDFHLLKQLNEFVVTVESLHNHIKIDSVWIMAKSKHNNGFQRWHKDFQLGTKITTTIVVNIGVQE